MSKVLDYIRKIPLNVVLLIAGAVVVLSGIIAVTIGNMQHYNQLQNNSNAKLQQMLDQAREQVEKEYNIHQD